MGQSTSSFSSPTGLRGNEENHQDDEATVDVSPANSLLGTNLLEADWDELRTHLATPEGRRDAAAGNDPLGLFPPSPDTDTCVRQWGIQNNNEEESDGCCIPRSKGSALFASLYVRAPSDIIRTIYGAATDHAEPDDLCYVLSVIPSEEEQRLRSTPSRPRESFAAIRQRDDPPYRTRAWSPSEHGEIVALLLEHAAELRTPDAFLRASPPWLLGGGAALTPLGLASYNPDVAPRFVRALCAAAPEAVDAECSFFGGFRTLPLHLAAASPLPHPDSASTAAGEIPRTAEATRRAKMKLLAMGSEWYRGGGDGSSEPSGGSDGGADDRLFTELNLARVSSACEEAVRRGEWELVRELLMMYYREPPPPELKPPGDNTTAAITSSPCVNSEHDTIAEPSKILRQIKFALQEHDERVRRLREEACRRQERSEWMHTNMGLVIYPLLVVSDLASVARTFFSGKRHNSLRYETMSHGIVPPALVSEPQRQNSDGHGRHNLTPVALAL